MSRSKKRAKKRPVQVSPEVRERTNKRLGEKWRKRAAKKGQRGTSPEVIEKIFSETAELPRQDKKADAARAAAERSKASIERKKASSTTPGKAKPAPHGKGRGTGGRMTRGS